MANDKKSNNRLYALNRSPFFRLESKARLAGALSLSLTTLQQLADAASGECYRMFTDKRSGRFITEPHSELAAAHKRIAKLLTRIAPPDFLHSATKGRSYKTNAEQHIKSTRFFKVDIRHFYTSITYGAVFRFFREKMLCSPDVSTILSKICTVSVNGRTHLPTGSSLSPILSYWVYSDLFDSVNLMCSAHGCAMSLYVDDLTVSGEKADKSLLVKIKKKITETGLRAHKIQIFDRVPATITGVIVYKKRLALPHARAKDIREHLRILSSQLVDTGKTLSVLVGKLNEAQQFVASYGEIKKRVLLQHAQTWQEITQARVRKSRVALARKRKQARAKKWNSDGGDIT